MSDGYKIDNWIGIYGIDPYHDKDDILDFKFWIENFWFVALKWYFCWWFKVLVEVYTTQYCGIQSNCVSLCSFTIEKQTISPFLSIDQRVCFKWKGLKLLFYFYWHNRIGGPAAKNLIVSCLIIVVCIGKEFYFT
jgi:hypothetical protein